MAKKAHKIHPPLCHTLAQPPALWPLGLLLGGDSAHVAEQVAAGLPERAHHMHAEGVGLGCQGVAVVGRGNQVLDHRPALGQLCSEVHLLPPVLLAGADSGKPEGLQRLPLHEVDPSICVESVLLCGCWQTQAGCWLAGHRSKPKCRQQASRLASMWAYSSPRSHRSPHSNCRGRPSGGRGEGKRERGGDREGAYMPLGCKNTTNILNEFVICPIKFIALPTHPTQHIILNSTVHFLDQSSPTQPRLSGLTPFLCLFCTLLMVPALTLYIHSLLFPSKMRRADKRAQDKTHNYKALIAQYYERDPLLQDAQQQLAPIAPDIQILEQLTHFEQKIDQLIKQKRYDVQELYMKPPLRIKRLLRIKAVRESHPTHQTVKVYGHMHPQKEENAGIKMTSFFRHLTVLSEKDKSVLEAWKKPTSNFTERDGLVVKLPSVIEEPVVVQLTMICNPPKYEVDPALEKIVGIRNGTRLEVLDAFWLYVKAKKLQDIENKEVINSDDLLRQAFKTEKLTFATINNRVRELLVPAEGVRITLAPGESKVYDVVVEVEEKPSVDIVPFFAQKLNQEKNDHPFLSLAGKIKKYDAKFKEHSEKLRRHLLKRNLYRDFRVERIEELLAEQEQLLAVLSQPDPLQDYGKLQYVLNNDEELEREVKHYFEQLATNSLPSNDR